MLNVLNATELYTLKHDYDDIFVLRRFYHNFKKCFLKKTLATFVKIGESKIIIVDFNKN